jgi:hypothetical protein
VTATNSPRWGFVANLAFHVLFTGQHFDVEPAADIGDDPVDFDREATWTLRFESRLEELTFTEVMVLAHILREIRMGRPGNRCPLKRVMQPASVRRLLRFLKLAPVMPCIQKRS